MNKHEIKSCPRCNKGFECKTGDIVRCQCENIQLENHHRDYIAQRYDDCLCTNCITEMRSEININLFTHKLSELIGRH